jgi:hypothetical protein
MNSWSTPHVCSAALGVAESIGGHEAFDVVGDNGASST